MMDEQVIEAILFLKPNGIPINQIQGNPEELMSRLNEKYRDTVLYVSIKNDRLVMGIKPEYIDKVAKYYEDKELTDRQLRVIGMVKINGKILKSIANKKLPKEELVDLINRGFFRVERIDRREYLVLGPEYYRYFGERND